MELVLSPGRLGGGDKNGSPFHNEEVREWSHVDRLTGMLEHARIETGRWQTRHLGSAQAYGKVIDSRERNSADGNVVQKARRQVEVFQSQGIGGRSVQVVRASQWSSSRITGSNSTSPVSVSTNETQFRNGNTDDLVLQASGKSVSGRPMQIQNSGGDESLAKLSQVSRLCRQINAEAINKRANIHSAATSNKPQMIHASPLLNSRFKRLDISNENVKQTSGFLQNTNSTFKTTSNEDLTNSIDNIKTHTKFSRDCKARRSLQIQKSIDSTSAPEKSTEKQEIIPLGFGRIENSSVSNGDLGFGESRSPRTNSTTSSDSDQETCVVKNERKAMKSYVLGMSDTDNDLITSSNLAVSEDKFPTEQSADLENGVGISKSEYLRPTAILLKPKTIQPVPTVIGKPNKTVVHLNNKLTIEKKTDQLLSNSLEKSLVTGNLIRPIAGMQSRVQSLADRFSNRNNNFISNANESMQMDAQSSFLIGRKQSFDSASRIESLISRSTAMIEGPSNTADETEPVLQVQQTRDKKLLSDDQSSSVVRPVKKVGFSKTEVHFAAESGKVNIVETDCKPPPSNRFRRRRRNSLVATNGTMPINKNLPLIHFGDTSYEKYIFGQGNNGGSIKSDFIPKDNKLPGEVEEPDLSAHFQIAEIKNDNDQKLVAPAEDIIKGGWGARIKTILQSDPELSIDDNGLGLNTADKKYDALDETIVDHSFKGHTTTVNLGANSISKQLQKHRNGDKPVDQNQIIGLSIDDNDDDELDIVNSGLPAVEEMCFEPNKTVEKSLVTDKLVANESNIVTTDNENNKVLLNIVKTHEPIIARVEDRLRSPEVGRKLFAIKKLRSHNSMQQPERKEKARREITAHQTSVNKSYLMSSTKTRIKPKAKDHCDDKNTKEVTNGSNDDSKTTDPTYVNIFENEKQNVPIYENYNVERKKNLMDNKYLKTNNHNGDSKVSAEFKTLTDATIQTSNSHYDTETTLSNTDCEGKNLKQYSNTSRSSDIAQLTTITENNSIKRTNIDGQKIKLSKTRSKKIPRPPSSTSSIESIHRSSGYETAKESQARSLHNRSTRSSRLHRVCNNRETSGNESSERYSSANEKKKNSSEQITNTRTSRSNHSADSSTATRNLNGSTRSKKPIEIVYQTAVYNMKNEKLSKSRSKESKTPRYINDLICGSKPAKRSTDVRHVKGPAPSQQRGNHKSASPTHRHWK